MDVDSFGKKGGKKGKKGKSDDKHGKKGSNGRGRGSSVASQVLTLVGGLVKLGASQDPGATGPFGYGKDPEPCTER